MRAAFRQLLMDPPVVAPHFELAARNSLTPEKAIDGTPTLTRSSTAKVMGYLEADNSGAVQTLLTIPANIPRYAGARFKASDNTWSPFFADGAPIQESILKGFVSEGARTNLCLQSEDLTGWASFNNVTVTTNAINAPDGTLTADKLTDTVSIEATHDVRQTITGTAESYTFSVYAKAGTKSWIKVYNGGAVTYFNLSTGVIGTNGNTFASIEALPNGWFRCSITNTYTAAARLHLIGITNADNASNYIGDGTGYVYFWGSQIEVDGFASSYIPTVAAAVSRSADILSYPLTNLNATLGGISFSFTPEHASRNSVYFIGSYVDANNSISLLHDSTKLIIRKRVAGVNYDAAIVNTFSAGVTYKIAMSWGNTGLMVAMEGRVSTSNDSTSLPLGTTIQIGANGNGASQLFGEIKDIKFYPKQINRTKLMRMTV